MEIISHTIRARVGDVINITPIGDIHADARAADLTKLRAVIRERAALPNSYFVGLGDFYEWIMPEDHRFSLGNMTKKMDDAVIDRVVEAAAKEFSGLQWLAMLAGNHCLKATKKLHTDPMERIAKMCSAPYGRYAARIIVKLEAPLGSGGGHGTHSSVRILAHHGAWGGDPSAGFGGAMRWARGYPGWDLFVYGHNHQSMVRSFDVMEQAPSGRTDNKSSHVLACGTFLNNGTRGYTTYSEKAGYGPVFIGCPLVRIRAGRRNCGVRIEVGDQW